MPEDKNIRAIELLSKTYPSSLITQAIDAIPQRDIKKQSLETITETVFNYITREKAGSLQDIHAAPVNIIKDIEKLWPKEQFKFAKGKVMQQYCSEEALRSDAFITQEFLALKIMKLLLEERQISSQNRSR